MPRLLPRARLIASDFCELSSLLVLVTINKNTWSGVERKKKRGRGSSLRADEEDEELEREREREREREGRKEKK